MLFNETINTPARKHLFPKNAKIKKRTLPMEVRWI
jgi:hypothetical protein